MLRLLEEKDGEFTEESVEGDVFIVSSRVNDLFMLFKQMIQKDDQKSANQIQMAVEKNSKIATNIYEISAELIRWYAIKISDDQKEKSTINTAKWIRLSNPYFFNTYCEPKSLGTEFLSYFRKLDALEQRKFILYFFNILHHCPPYGFTEHTLNQNVGTNWYCEL